MNSSRETQIVCTKTEDLLAGLVNLEVLTAELNEICRSASLGVAMKVGELVINRLYGGNLEQWHELGTTRPSYRALAARSDLELSASALCRAISIYALVQRLGGPARWQYIGASHFQEVLPLPDAEQGFLLSTADEQRWSVARLRAATKDRNTAGGKVPRSEVVRSIRRQGALLTKQLNLLLSDEIEDTQFSAIIDLQHRLEALLLKLSPADEGHVANERASRKSDISEFAARPNLLPKKTA